MNSIDVDDGPKVIKKYETSKDPGTGAVQYQQLGLPPEWTPPDNPTTEDISRWNEKLLTNGFEGATLTADCRLVVLAALPELKQDANRGRKVLKGAKAGHALCTEPKSKSEPGVKNTAVYSMSCAPKIPEPGGIRFTN
ncbi:MAG: hypothetical protein L0Y38_07060 [Methylococcaceae bacterium]|nr:hypothetical protein [Methylococcaceae bacterium]